MKPTILKRQSKGTFYTTVYSTCRKNQRSSRPQTRLRASTTLAVLCQGERCCMMHVNEIFYSLQGEGVCQGLPTVFIRLAGCNLLPSFCSWCDTQYAQS